MVHSGGYQVLPSHQPREEEFNGTENVRYIARQPILDLRGKVHGYELLFRNGPQSAMLGDPETATRTVVDSVVNCGPQDLTDGHLAFINCTDEFLMSSLPQVLPPDSTVLEILETVDPSPKLIECLCRLKKFGFKLALDDFSWEPRLEPLVDLADYVKVDFRLSGLEDRERLLRFLHGKPARIVAEKVESADEHQQACAEGFTLFQGYYFCRPVMMQRRRIPANTRSHLEILRELIESPLNLRRLCPLVESDASLSYRLLRLVNSAGYGVQHEVNSVHSALIFVGDDTFRRIATLAIASEFNAARPAEVLRLAMVRARFCETAAILYGLSASEQYLLGMASLFPAMLQVPIERIVPMLPLRREICDSLGGAPNLERCLLTWLESHEDGDWEAGDKIAGATEAQSRQLARYYSEAVLWADKTLRSMA